jgi:DNA-binding XRE family transcriptional regulator
MISVFNYSKQAEEALVGNTIIVGDTMRERAAEIYTQFIQVNSADEVNVSCQTRSALEKYFQTWKSTPMLTVALAQTTLGTDKYKRADVFKTAFQEISDIAFKNLWTKFRIEEAQMMACDDGALRSKSNYHSTSQIDPPIPYPYPIPIPSPSPNKQLNKGYDLITVYVDNPSHATKDNIIQ